MSISVSANPRSEKNAMSLLKSKKPRRKTITLTIEDEQVKLTFQAISSKRLDKLQEKYPPTSEQAANGASFNRFTFPPALISACAVEPEISLDDANEIWNSDEWSTGELNTLFDTVTSLCMTGMDVNFTEGGSVTTEPSA